jgi:hypothetical protein
MGGREARAQEDLNWIVGYVCFYAGFMLSAILFIVLAGPC